MIPLTSPLLRHRLARRGLAVLAALLALAGCTSGSADTAGPGCQADPGLVLVVSVHANTPGVTSLPAALACPIREAVAAGSPISVVAVDGTPQVLLAGQVYDLTAGNANARANRVSEAVNHVVATVLDARADTDGADLLGGITLAADLLAGAGISGARVAVIDSGLPDLGPLNMTAPGMTSADPAEVSAYLAAQQALPSLTGQQLDLYGISDVSAPQAPLNPAQDATVAAIWTTVLTDAGAQVRINATPRTGPGPDTDYKVTTIEVPLPAQPDFGDGATTVYDDTTPLGFQPGTTDLRDPDAAVALLTPLAQWLAEDPARRAHITGTTAGGGGPGPEGEAYRLNLSQARADRILEILTGLGADAAQISTTGVGTHFPEYIPDLLPSGELDPGVSVFNRTCRISTTG